MSSWRLFVAIQIGEDVRQNLAALQARLRKCCPNVRWTTPENIHMTLVFLGDAPAEMAPDISAVLAKAVEAIPAFSFGVGELGLFGPVRAPRIVWVGVNEGAAPLLVLYQSAATQLGTLNLTLETREFAPHLTIGRIKCARDAQGLADAVKAESSPIYGSVRVDSIQLMRSELLPQGVRYQMLSKAVLARQTP